MFLLGLFIVTIFTAILAAFWFYPPLWRDLLTIKIVFSFLRNFMKALKKRELIIDQFEKHALCTPEDTMLLFKDNSYSYGEVNNNACKVARALLHEGVSKSDTVALIMTNEPAYIWIYLGAQKIGARLALINTNLVSGGLVHSINACDPKLIIVGDGLLDDYLPGKVFKSVPYLETQALIFSYNEPQQWVNFPCFSQFINEISPEPIDPNMRSDIKLSDASAYIYTSGTTGLPKPAIITHKKAVLCSMTYSPIGFSKKDIVYLALPLYHASAMNLAVLNVINQGSVLVLKDKFSASQFWPDCVRYKATVVQYIGEMMRYLTNTPECPEEKQHSIWALAGNGLRRDVWVKLMARFKMPHVFEFYGSTEVPASLTNYFNEEGSVGRLSPLLSRLNGLVLVDVDQIRQRPYRNENGMCRKTLPGGSGVLMARLSDKVTFEGYLGPTSDTNSKVVTDVFLKADKYVTTGDTFYLDHNYNVYFKDRLGDSIRWKGENVSPMEVSNVLVNADFVEDANVFGVTVPGCEGKAGMAAISIKSGYELDDDKVEELGKLSKDNLPGFARPRFLRFQRQMSLTSVFKQNKLELSQEGFDITKVDDPLYFLHRKDDTYHPLDEEAYHNIVNGDQAL